MSKQYKLAIIGFGNVGQGFSKILSDKHALLKERFGVDISIVAVCDLHKGSIADPEGLDPSELLSHIEQYGNLNEMQSKISGWNAEEMIAKSGADILIELAYTDLKPVSRHLVM